MIDFMRKQLQLLFPWQVKHTDRKAQSKVMEQVRRFLDPPKLVYRKSAATLRNQLSQRVELEPQ